MTLITNVSGMHRAPFVVRNAFRFGCVTAFLDLAGFLRQLLTNAATCQSETLVGRVLGKNIENPRPMEDVLNVSVPGQVLDAEWGGGPKRRFSASRSGVPT